MGRKSAPLSHHPHNAAHETPKKKYHMPKYGRDDRANDRVEHSPLGPVEHIKARPEMEAVDEAKDSVSKAFPSTEACSISV